MPKAQVLVNAPNPKTGEPLAAGSTVDLDDDTYMQLRNAGIVGASEEETKEHQRDYDESTGMLKEGEGEGKPNYTARTTRADVGEQPKEPPPPEKKK